VYLQVRLWLAYNTDIQREPVKRGWTLEKPGPSQT